MEGRITKEEPLEHHPKDLPDEAPQEDPSPMSPRDVRRRVPEDPEVEYRRSSAPAATDLKAKTLPPIVYKLGFLRVKT